MQNELIAQGVSLMLLGMGIVFVFLTLLVIATGAMSELITRYFPEPLPLSPPAPPDSQQTDPRTLAAIKAAIAQHRTRTRQR